MPSRSPAREWEIEVVRAGAAKLAALGLLPSRRAIWAIARIGVERVRRGQIALRDRGEWPYPDRVMGPYRSPSPDELAALAGPERADKYHRLGNSPRDRVGPKELRARAVCERVRSSHATLDRRDVPRPPTTNREWCQVYLSDWRARRRRDLTRRGDDGVADGRGGRGAA